MTHYLKLAYVTGCHSVFHKLGLEQLPQLGAGERDMLQDPDFPEDMRRTELDSYLQRAITTPISPEQDFMSEGKTKGTLGGGALGGGIGALTGGALGSLAKRPGMGALIGGLGAGTLGALIGRPLGAESGRREHKSQSDEQEDLGSMFADPYKMHRELQLHLADGRRKKLDDDRDHDEGVARAGRAPLGRINYNIDGQ